MKRLKCSLALLTLVLLASDALACPTAGRFRERVSVRHVERTNSGVGSRLAAVTTTPFRLFGVRSVGGCGSTGCATATATATVQTIPMPTPVPEIPKK